VKPQIFTPGAIHPEADYERLIELSVKLGIPVSVGRLKLESRDSSGGIIQVHNDRLRTWNRNFWNSVMRMWACMASNVLTSSTTFAAGYLSLKTVGGVVNNANNGAYQNYTYDAINMASTTTTAGIVVGTSSAAENFEGSALGTLIAAGTGAGQMSYQTPIFQQPTYNAGTKTWTQTLVRVMNNNSGGTIVVAEAGIYVWDSGAPGAYMIERSLLSSPVSVLTGGQLTVTYTFTLTFPA